MSKNETRTCLGDGVYADCLYGQIELMTLSGLNDQDDKPVVDARIYIEPQVLKALNEYAEKMRKESQF